MTHLTTENKTSSQSATPWILLILDLIPIGMMVIMLILAKVGECEGALGSGVVCERIDFSTLLMGGEGFFLMISLFYVPLLIASFIVGIIGLWKRRGDVNTVPLLKSPHLYLIGYPVMLMVFLFSSFIVIWGISISSFVKDDNVFSSNVTNPLNESKTVAVNQGEEAASSQEQQPYSNLNTTFKLTRPNGGEVLKIGSNSSVMWNAQRLPSGVQLDTEIYAITGDKVMLSKDGVCLNCIGGGLRSGISAVSPVGDGDGSREWKSVGITYSGNTLNPGNHYVMKATISRTGTYDKGECPEHFATCIIYLGADWSDKVFTLVN